MKFNLPPRSPRAEAPHAHAATLKGEFYLSAEDAARRKQAILAQAEQGRMLAKAALHAGRLGRQTSHL